MRTNPESRGGQKAWDPGRPEQKYPCCVDTTKQWGYTATKVTAGNKQGVTVEVTKGNNTSSQPCEAQLLRDGVKLGALVHRGLRGSGVPPLLFHPACCMGRDHSNSQNETHHRAKSRSTARKRHSFECVLFCCCQISSGILVTLREKQNFNIWVGTTTSMNIWLSVDDLAPEEGNMRNLTDNEWQRTKEQEQRNTCDVTKWHQWFTHGLFCFIFLIEKE